VIGYTLSDIVVPGIAGVAPFLPRPVEMKRELLLQDCFELLFSFISSSSQMPASSRAV
jgi:hypothetical protein